MLAPSLLLPLAEFLTLQQDSNPRFVLGIKDILPEYSSEPLCLTLTCPSNASTLLARGDSTLPSNKVLCPLTLSYSPLAALEDEK